MISVSNLTLYFSDCCLFDNISFLVQEHDKIGLTGKNGAGKSTLLKILAGEFTDYEGNVISKKDIKIAYLPQYLKVDSSTPLVRFVSNTTNKQLNEIHEKIQQIEKQLETVTDNDLLVDYSQKLYDLHETANKLSADFDQGEVEKVLLGLGFEKNDFSKPVNTFSGGWKMRAKLAALILASPHVLLLDEPTNHLDIESIIWLENFLKDFKGAVILTSHDKQFIDNITNRTIEIAFSKIYDYKCNYSKYLEKRKEEIERLKQAKKDQEKEIKRTKELINKFRAKNTKASFAQSLIKKLEKTEIIEIEEFDYESIHLRFPQPSPSGKDVLKCIGLSVKYNENYILKNVSLQIARGEKIALTGKNGAGKTTFIKAIINQIPSEGIIKWGHNVQVGYFAQDSADKLNDKLTVLETMETLENKSGVDLRQVLGSFLFSGDDVDKQVGVLSGGERTRLALCKLLLEPCNTLILDEPTNHLDIPGKQVLKEALGKYDGTLIIVSHDREFLSGLTQRVWEVKQQRIADYHYEFSEYLTYKRQENNEFNQPQKPDKKTNLSRNGIAKPKSGYEIQKERKKLLQKIQKIENKIEKTEEQLQQKEEEIYENPGNMQLIAEYEEIKNRLDSLMEEWEKLSLQTENQS
ncbi:MAG: ABC transporter ATP-binding protein [Bacteroidetes bacterium]|nr:MAG: ABC transporter ATP-binding protein [Bacteroidota bacterium]